MSVMVDLPPMIERDMQYCIHERGVDFSQLFFSLIEKEAARIRSEKAKKAEASIAGLKALVKETSGRLDKPYKFNRADAYEPEVAYS